MTNSVHPREAASTARGSFCGFKSRLADYWMLTKPEVNFLVVASALVGFYLGSRGPLHWALMFNTLLGTFLVASGTATLPFPSFPSTVT